MTIGVRWLYIDIINALNKFFTNSIFWVIFLKKTDILPLKVAFVWAEHHLINWLQSFLLFCLTEANKWKMNQKNNYLIIYVKYVSSLNSLQAIADLFGVCETTVHVIVKYVADIICKHILTSVIRCPSSYPNPFETICRKQ